MDSQKSVTTNYWNRYKNLIDTVKQFKGEESYILSTIQKLTDREEKLEEFRVTNLREVSKLITSITFNMI